MSELQVDFVSEGVVTYYRSEEDDRYAFVTPSDGKVADRIFVNRKCMKRSGVDSLSKGTRVRCRGAYKEKGPKAKRIEVLL